MSHQLSHWRGECAIAFVSENHTMELVFVDSQDSVLSYQILDYGTGAMDRKKFHRVEYGRMDLSEFQESTYASITDFMLRCGLEGYLEQFEQKFPMGDYERLARLLKRPKHLPELGQDEDMDEDSDDQIMGETIVWETEEDDESLELEPEKMTHPEFQKLGWLIKTDKKL